MPGPGGAGGFAAHSFLTEEEKADAPHVTKELPLRILSHLKPYWLQFLLVFAAIIVASAVGLLPAITLERTVWQSALA